MLLELTFESLESGAWEEILFVLTMRIRIQNGVCADYGSFAQPEFPSKTLRDPGPRSSPEHLPRTIMIDFYQTPFTYLAGL